MEKALFECYKKNYDALVKILGDKTPRNLRIFDIRLRLFLGMSIDYDPAIAYVKDKYVKECNILRLKLIEMWNVHEALVAYLSVLDKYKNKKWYDIPEKLKSNDINNLFSAALTNIRTRHEKERFEKNFGIYIDKILQDEHISKTNRDIVTKLLKCLIDGGEITGKELLNLICIERNMFVHNGEAVKMGMYYADRKKLLEIYLDTLTQYVLHSAIYVFKNQL
jgi:hypothetical protein